MNALAALRVRRELGQRVADAWRSDGVFRLALDDVALPVVSDIEGGALLAVRDVDDGALLAVRRVDDRALLAVRDVDDRALLAVRDVDDGALVVARDAVGLTLTPVGPQLRRAFASIRRFFALSAGRKSRFVSDLTYAGYVAERPGCEAFTVCQDIALDDPRVRERWPCHGPMPWPDAEFRRAMLALTDTLGAVADWLLREVALGLGLDDPDVFARLTWSGWHHLRAAHVLPDRVGSAATDDGLLVISMQDDSDVLTVLPGAVMQFVTGGKLASVSQDPQPEARERYTMTYFHVPNFQVCVRPAANVSGGDCLHYGTHFTNTFMRRYPERATTLRILAEERLAVLTGLREQAARVAIPV